MSYSVNTFYFILPNLKKRLPYCKPYFNESNRNFVLCPCRGRACVCMKMYPATYLINAIYWYWQVNLNIWYRDRFNVSFFRGFIVVHCTKRVLQGVACNNMNSAYISLSVNLIYWLLRQTRVCNFFENINSDCCWSPTETRKYKLQSIVPNYVQYSTYF